MRKTLLLFLFLPLWAAAQVVDDFSDGDFTTNPVWVGCDTNFFVNSGLQLQSTATAAGEAYLSLRLSRDTNKEWRFWIRETFSPSANNYAEVWLSADTSDLTQASRGYFLRFGSAGSQDAIELYRKDPTGTQLICHGADAAIASSFKVAVKVIRAADGRWTVATDYDNVGDYGVEAEGVDESYALEGWFGFHTKYTASNARKFYFDDVYVGPEIIDTEPPELLSLEVRDNRHLLLAFSESLATSALEAHHYSVEPGDGHPATVTFAERPSQVLLDFDDPLPENTSLTLRVNDLADLAGNMMLPTEWQFAVYQVAENDVVVNEIMADPTPVVGLPEWEYVELFNTTEFAIDLTGWSFLIGTAAKTFPAVQMEPKGYLILCKTDAERELMAYGATCGFPSFAIANAGATLRLVAPDETVVSEVSFNDNWYHDATKKNGGWSIEQVDPFNPCAGTVNWSASTDPSGGTPGRINSIDAPNATVPQVARVSMLGDNMVLLWFDQQMDRATLTDPSRYLVEELDINPSEVVCNPIENSSLELVFDYAFMEGLVYTLSLNGLESCSGQPIAPDTKVRFGIPNEISHDDILINEILFDPISPGVDYVELYNCSDKTFDLSELRIGAIRESFPNPPDTTLKAITADSRLFMPHTYLLISTDGYTVGQQYQCAIDNFFDMESFPSYPNAGGTVLLMSRAGVVVDQMSYSEQMHYPLLKETKGVALERVSWKVPSEQADNWHSAAEAAHFGTPGYQNSMMNDLQEHEVASPITVLPSVFSPDGDGFDDNCQISYRFDVAGMTMNAYVFNVEGQMVRHLVKGEWVAGEGGFVWNGLDSRGNRVPTGLYVVVTEVFDLDGTVKSYKNAVAVASR